jgi:hypothetical protein
MRLKKLFQKVNLVLPCCPLLSKKLKFKERNIWNGCILEKLAHFSNTIQELCIGLVNKKLVSAAGRIVRSFTIVIRDLGRQDQSKDPNQALLQLQQENDQIYLPKSKQDSTNLIKYKNNLCLLTISATRELKPSISQCLIKTLSYFMNHSNLVVQ